MANNLLDEADKSILSELHNLLDCVYVDGEVDVTDVPPGNLQSVLGQTLYEVLHRSQRMTEKFRHAHKGPSRTCMECGFDVKDAIHRRRKG
jgi:hypothetical protein